MVIAPPLSRSSPPTRPMANGFSLNETAYRLIRAERFSPRHSSNSWAVTGRIPLSAPRLFRNSGKSIAL
jgi:hypothetical protein